MKRAKGGSSSTNSRNSNNGGLLPHSLRVISSCLKTVSSNAGSVASTVRSAGASVAASIAAPPDTDEKDQVLWAGFDKLELSPSSFKNVLLLGYSNGFQVMEVEDASDVHELVSKRDGAVTFLQIQPIPAKSEGAEGFRSLHPMLLIVAGDETDGSGLIQGGRLSALIKDNGNESQHGNCTTPTTVRFFSLRSNSYVHVLRFRSTVYVVRCSPRIVAVSLAAQIYCFDSATLENKFSVLTYPIQGAVGINVGYGPMTVGSRWLAYASNNPLISNSGRLSPQSLTPSPGVSPSSSPGSGNFVARYAMESSKQLAAGIVNLGDMGYKTISKYCQDLLPDGSTSPISPNSGRKVGRSVSSMHPSEADNAGMVVVKDFVSKDIIAQFRAHSNPISALCFDPSGTLLVTASVYGNNINIFRIIPKSASNGASTGHYDWSSSHVHLYKLYRGLTSAIIQDISFSSYSQWISIVSSRGTCHVYLLSPFGGDASLQAQNISGEKPVLVPNISLPWWSSSSSSTNQQFFPPPPPITLSVVSRIKNSNSGWLNTVSTVAASASGKTPLPSGAVATVFHNTMHDSFREHNSKANSLEHLLVCSPSGHLTQHDLLPSVVESSDSSSRIGSSSHFAVQDEELRVNAEPVQWWDACRRSNWPERLKCMSSSTLDHHETSEVAMEISDNEENDAKTSILSTNAFLGGESMKAHEKSRWFLSNAEVKGSSRQIPIWQKSKISFYVVNPPRNDWRFNANCCPGEIEIEKFPIRDVEIKQKDLLPVFQRFHHAQSDCNDRKFAYGECSTVSSEVCQARNRLIVDTATRHSSIISDDSLCTVTEIAESSCNAGKVNFPNLWQTPQSVKEPDYYRATQVGHLIVKEDNPSRRSMSMLSQIILGTVPISCQDSKSLDSSPSHVVSPILDVTVHESEGLSFSGRATTGDFGSSNCLSGATTSFSDPGCRVEQMEDRNSHCLAEVSGYLQEGYCKLSDPDDCHDSTEAVTDADSNCSHCDRDKPEDDGDNEDMLGGVFAFSEEVVRVQMFITVTVLTLVIWLFFVVSWAKIGGCYLTGIEICTGRRSSPLFIDIHGNIQPGPTYVDYPPMGRAAL